MSKKERVPHRQGMCVGINVFILYCYEALSLVGATVQQHLSPFPAAVTRRSRAPYTRSNDNKCTAEVEQHFFLILI